MLNLFAQISVSCPDKQEAEHILQHCARTAYCAFWLAEKLGLSNQDTRNVSAGALLHDIGKIFLPISLLEKPAGLDKNEWAQIHQHPSAGVEFLKKNAHLDIFRCPEIIQGIEYHHEHYDGSGYPHGLAGDAIPMTARIIAVVDTWDVMRSTRAYKASRNISSARQEMINISWAQLDGDIVRVFLRML